MTLKKFVALAVMALVASAMPQGDSSTGPQVDDFPLIPVDGDYDYMEDPMEGSDDSSEEMGDSSEEMDDSSSSEEVEDEILRFCPEFELNCTNKYFDCEALYHNTTQEEKDEFRSTLRICRKKLGRDKIDHGSPTKVELCVLEAINMATSSGEANRPYMITYLDEKMSYAPQAVRDAVMEAANNPETCPNDIKGYHDCVLDICIQNM